MKLTERKIIDAAIHIFNDDLSATLEMVAGRAGMTRRTLHRYFNDRVKLIESCKNEMMASCKTTMAAAYNSSDDPLKQLELMLYAGIDCNHKYAFLNKLHQRAELQSAPENKEAAEFDNIKDKWNALISLLQDQEIISNQLTVSWIYILFGGMINTTINALSSGNVAKNDIKKFAWFSFSKSIGIK